MPTEVLNEQEGKTDREHERILNEIETTDTAFIGASLRYICIKFSGFNHVYISSQLRLIPTGTIGHG